MQQHGRSQANALLAMLMEIVKMARGPFATVANN
jgi:type IV secretory pathway VirB2 component (pilin)